MVAIGVRVDSGDPEVVSQRCGRGVHGIARFLTGGERRYGSATLGGIVEL